MPLCKPHTESIVDFNKLKEIGFSFNLINREDTINDILIKYTFYLPNLKYKLNVYEGSYKIDGNKVIVEVKEGNYIDEETMMGWENDNLYKLKDVTLTFDFSQTIITDK